MEEKKAIDLLEEMKKASQKNLMYQRISTILMLIFVMAILFLIPDVISTLDTAKATLNHMNDAITKMEPALDSIQILAVEGETAITGIEEALQKVNQFDIETLNQAIKDLSNIVEQMAGFFGMFNRN